jgi:GTP-binding protein
MKVISAEFKKGIVGRDEILFDGKPQFAFIGRSNVGKSSIINALLNRRDLVKTGKKPGKTTEINFFLINRKFYFVDLPGYGFAKGSLEKRQKIRDLILWYLTDSEFKPKKIILILDVKAGLTAFDKEMLEYLKNEGRAYLIVANKADKLNKTELTHKLEQIKELSGKTEIIVHSVTKKIGTGELANHIFND